MITPLSPEEAARLAASLDPASLDPAAAARVAAALPDELRETVCPQLELTKLFMAAGPRARREFLADAKAADPALFAEIAEGAR